MRPIEHGGFVGHATRRTNRPFGTVAQPKVCALERQLASLMAEARGVTFTDSAGGGLSPAFVSALAIALADVVGDRPPPTDDERRAAVGDLPLGVVPSPPSAPDGELKVISCLTQETAAHGCPRCDALLSSVFSTPDVGRAYDPDLPRPTSGASASRSAASATWWLPTNFTSFL